MAEYLNSGTIAIGESLIPPPINGHARALSGEALKAQLVPLAAWRSADAREGVKPAELQHSVDDITVGPYGLESIYRPVVTDFLSDPRMTLPVTAGRNEHRRGNLGPTLSYLNRSTGDQPGNAVFVDGDSPDGSAEFARTMGVEVHARKAMLTRHFDVKALADIMGISTKTLLGETQGGEPPMRKGVDIMLVRTAALKRKLEGRGSRYMLYIDSDLKSIPGGEVENDLSPEKVYHPIQLLGAAAVELAQGRDEKGPVLAIFTGSGNRNNEPVFAAYNTSLVEATSPFRSPRQRAMARANYEHAAKVVHPLTGELLVATDAELNSMNASGQCTETARSLTLAGMELEAYIRAGSATHRGMPISGTVRRGVQERMDEPQSDAKEWLMIAVIIPQFQRAVEIYSMETGKFPHQLTLGDYAHLNDWLRNINEGSHLDAKSQTRIIEEFPMERAIPSVQQMYEAGIIRF